MQTDLREIALLDRRGTNSAKWDSLLATFGPILVEDQLDFTALDVHASALLAQHIQLYFD